MITLPDRPAPTGLTFTYMDFGRILRPPSGAKVLRVDRKGNRFALHITTPPMELDEADDFVSLLLQAKTEGLRMRVPLLGRHQGSPGTPVVDGSGQAGTTVNLRGLTPYYQLRRHFWMTIVAADGTYYLHRVAAPVRADVSGEASVVITPELRAPFADGDSVLLGKPMVEGIVPGEAWEWQVPTNHLMALQFSVEEAE